MYSSCFMEMDITIPVFTSHFCRIDVDIRMGCSTWLPISTRLTIIYHHTSLNNKTTTTYDVGNPGPVFARAQGKNIAGSKRLMKFLDN
jgi:hypothetical protein